MIEYLANLLLSVPTIFADSCRVSLGLPGGSVASILLPMQEMRVGSLGQEDPLEKEMATHSSTLAWGIPWTEEPGGLQSMGSQRAGHDLASTQQQQYKVFLPMVSLDSSASFLSQVSLFKNKSDNINFVVTSLTSCYLLNKIQFT